MNYLAVALTIIGSILLIFSFFQRNSNFLDLRLIFKQHFSVFKGSPLQFISIFIVPALFSFIIAQTRCIDKEIINNINIVLAILISMFFAILGILCSFVDKEKKDVKYNKLLKETFNATIFEVVVCLFLLFIAFIQLFAGEFCESLVLQIISGVIYYVAMVSVLNIFVIIKRLKVLFDNK